MKIELSRGDVDRLILALKEYRVSVLSPFEEIEYDAATELRDRLEGEMRATAVHQTKK